jgi:hypothetical protein
VRGQVGVASRPTGIGKRGYQRSEDVLKAAFQDGQPDHTVRRIVYFSANGITTHLLVLSAWIVAGAAIALVGSLRYDRRTRPAISEPAA